MDVYACSAGFDHLWRSACRAVGDVDLGYGLRPVVLDFASNFCLGCFGFAIGGASIGNGRGHGVFRRSTDNEICHCLRSGAEWNCAFFGPSPFAA